MKQVVKVKLLPTSEQATALAATLRTCNQVADGVSHLAHGRGAITGSKIGARNLQKIAYSHAKRAGLSAQPALLVISKVAGAYATLRSNLRNGRYGPKGGKRQTKIEATPIEFRPTAAQPFDDRCLSWQHDPATDNAGTVSIWTVTGRMKNIAFVGHPDQVALLRAHRKGETDLVEDGGRFYLIATVDIDEPALTDGPHLQTAAGWLGVDLGIENIAVTSDPALAKHLMTDYGSLAPDGPAGRGSVKNRRTRNRELREKLQKKGTKSAKRLLKKRRRKEARFAADVNHQISKQIVAEAERTGRGIAIEELTGIRARVRLRKPQRATHSSWAFAQLGAFLQYKARRAGVPFVQVDPAYTSQQCSACGHREKKNRPNQATFSCRSETCGVSLNADYNAALNIAARGPDHYAAAVNLPNAA